MDLTLLKAVHVSCVAASYGLFVVRGAAMLRDPPLLAQRWVRVAPHVIDTLLLMSAIWLAITIGQYPFVHDWLTAKVLALPIYIILGSIALKHGKNRRTRLYAWIAAQAVFLYIIAVAVTHVPLPFRLHAA